MMKKKKFWLILLMVFILMLSGCKIPKNDSDKKSKIEVENAMTFTISSECSDNENEVVALVHTQNNPGFLTMAVQIDFNPKYLNLTKIENGEDFVKYNFIPPKNKQSGCRASWFITDLPNNHTDGELLKLYFTILNKAEDGDYTVTISPINDGGIVDGNKKLITIVECKDSLEIK